MFNKKNFSRKFFVSSKRRSICFDDKKAEVAMPFNWIFAIIVGIIILFIAIFAVTKFMSTSGNISGTESAQVLISLLDPMETGIGSGKSRLIDFKNEIRIKLECDYLDNRPFGKEFVSISEKDFRGKFNEIGEPVSITNKYVFSTDNTETSKVYLFSKPIFVPFKIADIIMFVSRDYCFYKAPEDIKEDLRGYGIKFIHFSEDLRNCTGIKVCFKNEDCDIIVLRDSNRVINNKIQVGYNDNLLYAAIFSSPQIYECNFKRLMNKAAEVGEIYLEKMKIMEKNGCSSILGPSISNLVNSTREMKSSKEIDFLTDMSKEIESLNSKGCRVY